MEPETRQAIPFSAFVDAVDEYTKDSNTDSEGDMRIAQQYMFVKNVAVFYYYSFNII